MRRPRNVGRLLEFVLFSIVYVVAGKLGLRLAFVHASATAVWAPTGIALAALLLRGVRLWPAVLLGAFAVNVTTGVSIATAAGIAVGNALEAVLARTWSTATPEAATPSSGRGTSSSSPVSRPWAARPSAPAAVSAASCSAAT